MNMLDAVIKYADENYQGHFTLLSEYCGRFLPVVRFFLPLFAGGFTNVCGIVYQ